MTLLSKEKLVCIDCEATGLDPEKDQIIEVAVAQFDLEKTYDSFESLVDPQCTIPEISIAIHHITEEMVKGKPTIDKVLPQVIELIGKYTIIGHNISYDIALIANAAKRYNIPCAIEKNVSIDTLRMARAYGQSPKNSLEKLREHFNIEPEGAHRAMNDVVVNIDVFRQLAKDYKTIGELLKVLSKPVKLKTMPLGQHKGRSFNEIPLNYLKWAANKDFDQDLLYSIRAELNKRKKGDSFGQVSNPFHGL